MKPGSCTPSGRSAINHADGEIPPAHGVGPPLSRPIRPSRPQGTSLVVGAATRHLAEIRPNAIDFVPLAERPAIRRPAEFADDIWTHWSRTLTEILSARTNSRVAFEKLEAAASGPAVV